MSDELSDEERKRLAEIARQEAASGSMYYRIRVDDGSEVQVRVNPFELPTTTEAPNVEVTFSQVLRHKVTGQLFQAPDGFYWDGQQMFRSVAAVAS